MSDVPGHNQNFLLIILLLRKFMDLLSLKQLVDRVRAGQVFVVNVGEVVVHLTLHLGKHLIFAMLELGRIVG